MVTFGFALLAHVAVAFGPKPNVKPLQPHWSHTWVSAAESVF